MTSVTYFVLIGLIGVTALYWLRRGTRAMAPPGLGRTGWKGWLLGGIDWTTTSWTQRALYELVNVVLVLVAGLVAHAIWPGAISRQVVIAYAGVSAIVGSIGAAFNLRRYTLGRHRS
ncbi:MAG TPA: hypothetical protein VFI42_11215 [Thermomicrobiaceae bacterium]|nr:hypothetical protein [Thermomicrobiaceae bacterium]